MKTYMIVTNDRYELPVSGEIVGAEAVADKLGVPLSRVRQGLHRGFAKKAKYKVVVVKDRQVEDKQRHNREYSKRYGFTHDRTEYFREWYRRKKVAHVDG